MTDEVDVDVSIAITQHTISLLILTLTDNLLLWKVFIGKKREI